MAENTAEENQITSTDGFFELSQDLLCIININGYIKQCNPRFAELFGYSFTELNLMAFVNLLHPDEKKSIEEQFASLNHHQQSIQFRVRGRRSNAQYSWLQFIAIFDKPQKLIYLTGHRASEDMREARLNHYAQHVAKIGSWELDLINGKLFWSDEMYTIHGLSPDKYTPAVTTALAFYTEDSLPIIRQAIKDCIDSQQAFALDLEIMSDNQRQIAVHVTGEPVVEDDRVKMICGSLQKLADVTPDSPQLRSSSQCADHTLALANSPVGLWDWDINSGKMVFSENFKKMLGYSNEEFADEFSSFERSLHREDQDQTIQSLYQYLEDRKPFTVEFRLVTKDDNVMWFSATGQARWDEGGKATHMAGIFCEINDKKSLEKKVIGENQAKQQLEKQFKQIEVLLSTAGNAGDELINYLNLSLQESRQMVDALQIPNKAELIGKIEKLDKAIRLCESYMKQLGR
ncbi:MAG: hypothetical protein CMF50_01700 [Legionellales bacterium]|nr:hypothetical protein [Legionellales bacterium]|tara:strand:+ start:31161 stop:32540 length:1380 start_codon:yes stop_codon:yes gene_type:complete